MLAGIFIYGGVDALSDPESKAKAADDVAPMLAEALRLPATDTVTLVRINGGIQVLAGTMLAIGKARRVSALVLAASLIPTTYAGHRFWEITDDEQRAKQRVQFLKNVAMLGGLLLAAADTGGRPSVPWQARKAAAQAAQAAVAAGAATEEAAKQVVASTREAKKATAGVVAAATSLVFDGVKTSDLKSNLSKKAPKAAKKARRARKVQLAKPVQKLVLVAQESDITERAVKGARKAARKARKAEFTRGALKAAKKAAKKAEKADLTRRATRMARRAAKRANKAQLASQAKATGATIQRAATDAIGRARDTVGDGRLERIRESAAAVTREIADRAKDSLPAAS